jgi:nitrogen-specific signal transduction histidine kinase
MEESKTQPYSTAWAEQVWAESWTYIKTVVDTIHEPFLILDKNLCVLAANKAFYQLFQVEAKDTEHKYVYELGNGEWNIPALEALLKVILPRNTFFNGFEVNSKFPLIGRKIMLLNGRRIYIKNEVSEIFPPLIMLAMEDITEMTIIAEKLAAYAADIETKVMARTKELEGEVNQLKKDVSDLKIDSHKKGEHFH